MPDIALSMRCSTVYNLHSFYSLYSLGALHPIDPIGKPQLEKLCLTGPDRAMDTIYQYAYGFDKNRNI